MANKQDFTDALNSILVQAKKDKKDTIEVLSKDLHDSVASKNENSMPNCCNAMKDIEPINFLRINYTPNYTPVIETTPQ